MKVKFFFKDAMCPSCLPPEIPYLRRKVGIVLQDFRLLPKKTVFDNVSLPLLVQGAAQGDIRRKVLERSRPSGLIIRKTNSLWASRPANNSGCVLRAQSSMGRSSSLPTSRPVIWILI